MQYLTCLRQLAIVAAMALASDAPAQTNFPIYAESLSNGFVDWSWASRSLINTSPVHSGEYSIRVEATGWQGLYFYHAGLDTTRFEKLSFWAHGGQNGGQRIQVQALLGNSNAPTEIYQRRTLTADSWQLIEIPLAHIGVANQTNLTGFWIQMTPTGSNGTFYVDDVQLDVKAAPATAPAAAPAAESQPPAKPPAPAEQPKDRANWWIVGSLATIIGLLGLLVFLFWRRGSTSLALQPSQDIAKGNISDVGEWKQRAIMAEEMAGKQGQMLREKIMPEITEFAKQSLVQGLFTQRNVLIETQRKAQMAITELESRLAGLQLPLQERIRAYEKRIAELEREVKSQGAEMVELTRATIVLMRKKLEDEREHERGDSSFN